jgi:hypothetical protein
MLPVGSNAAFNIKFSAIILDDLIAGVVAAGILWALNESGIPGFGIPGSMEN